MGSETQGSSLALGSGSEIERPTSRRAVGNKKKSPEHGETLVGTKSQEGEEQSSQAIELFDSFLESPFSFRSHLSPFDFHGFPPFYLAPVGHWWYLVQPVKGVAVSVA